VLIDLAKRLLNASSLTLHFPGPEIDPAKFIRFMYPRIDAPSDFDYPADRLLRLQGILSAEEMHTPNNKDHDWSFEWI